MPSNQLAAAQSGRAGDFLTSKLRRVYRETGLRGFLLRALRKALLSSGNALIALAGHVPRALLSPAIIRRDDREALLRNARFKDLHRGRRCFVIGNGSSLQGQDLTPLESEVTFVVNSFFRHSIVERWQPTYYSLIDPMLFVLDEPTVAEFHRSLSRRIHASTFFVPLYYYEPLPVRTLVEAQRLLPPERTFFVALDDPRSKERTLELDPTGFIHSVFNVVQLNVLLAIYMGCSPVYLLGLDHDWLAHPSEDRHFYPRDELRWSLPGPPPNRQDRSYSALMERQLTLWFNYGTLQRMAQAHGIEIVDLTRGGFLDVFPRSEYETVVSERRKAHEKRS